MQEKSKCTHIWRQQSRWMNEWNGYDTCMAHANTNILMIYHHIILCIILNHTHSNKGKINSPERLNHQCDLQWMHSFESKHSNLWEHREMTWHDMKLNALVSGSNITCIRLLVLHAIIGRLEIGENKQLYTLPVCFLFFSFLCLTRFILRLHYETSILSFGMKLHDEPLKECDSQYALRFKYLILVWWQFNLILNGL